jgi:hypothetical protein
MALSAAGVASTRTDIRQAYFLAYYLPPSQYAATNPPNGADGIRSHVQHMLGLASIVLAVF